MEDINTKVEQQEGRLNRSIIHGISSSCDDLLEEKLCSDSKEPIGLITQEETQRPNRRDVGSGSPQKGRGKKRGIRKISMPWFRQSSFGIGLAKLRLPRQHTIASTNSDSPIPYHPDGEGTSCRAVSSSELLHRKVRSVALHPSF